MLNGSASQKYIETRNKPELLDLDLRGVPENVDTIALKKLAGVRHIVEADFKHDAMKGVHTGEGRLKIRLNEGETAE